METASSIRIPPEETEWSFCAPEHRGAIASGITGCGWWAVEIPGAVLTPLRPAMVRAAPQLFAAREPDSRALLQRRFIPAAAIIDVVGRENWQAMPTVAVVRNPWERMVAVFLDMTRDGKLAQLEFEPFIRGFLEPVRGTPPWNWFGSYLRCADFLQFRGRSAVRHVVPYENPHSALLRWQSECSEPVLSAAQLEQLQPQRIEDFRDYYNRHTEAIVARAFKADAELMDYAFADA